VSDSLYNSHHPCILFTAGKLSALRVKLSDGGYDDTAYEYIRNLAGLVYAHLTPANLVSQDYGLNPIANLGLAALVPSPPDTTAVRAGRNATLYLAGAYGPDNNEADTGLRLRSLTLGYDMFFGDADDSLRTYVRDEIVSYLEHMTQSFTYELFTWRPYLANHSAMFAGPLGMAAICLQDETGAGLLDDAMAQADATIDSLIAHQFDPGGSYKEGVLYGAWTARQLIFYFHARKNFDGYNYADRPEIRNMERWFAYELLPEGWGKTNNLNDSPYSTTPLARHSTYLDWAQSEWNSGLSAWLWEHTAGPYGIDLQTVADKAATALWNLGLPAVPPGSVLPASRLWLDRGLYVYRDGWQGVTGSKDVTLSFYSGKFHGGHAQEDQNQFTLYAYGGKFAIDHGAGSTAAQSEAHNMVFIDGAGQHNAGGSIGTDGKISDYLTGDFADYVQGDATAAYNTYSEFNTAGWPFAGWDWSWGYSGANPVIHALRNVLAVKGGAAPAWFLIADDINKDGGSHNYQWRMHTPASNIVDVSGNPVRIGAGGAQLDLHVLYPEYSSVAASKQFFNNGVADPNSMVLQLDHVAVNPRFSVLMVPSDSAVTAPAVSRSVYPWGYVCELAWPGGPRDVVIGNHTGAPLTAGPDSIRTDAATVVVRFAGGTVSDYLAVDATLVRVGRSEYLRVSGQPVTASLDGDVLRLGRADATFMALDTGINRVTCGDDDVPFVRHAGYVLPASPVAAGPAKPYRKTVTVTAYPNPFNPGITVRIHAPAGTPLTAAIYDPAGRLVRRLSGSHAGPGPREYRWNGDNFRGQHVASGIYFVRVRAGGQVYTRKIVLLK
jgi:hypothetical protein